MVRELDATQLKPISAFFYVIEHPDYLQ